MSRAWKLSLLALVATLFIGWLIWYATTYARVRRQTIVSVAAQVLNCPAGQLMVGPSAQANDGPSEIPVEGCGRNTTIACEERNASSINLRQYISFDFSCQEVQP